jgi:hypothetical protein
MLGGTVRLPDATQVKIIHVNQLSDLIQVDFEEDSLTPVAFFGSGGHIGSEFNRGDHGRN